MRVSGGETWQGERAEAGDAGELKCGNEKLWKPLENFGRRH